MTRVSNVRAARVLLPDGREAWTVVDHHGGVVEVADTYLNGYLRATDASLNTRRSYARHLALFFRWLDLRDYDWERLDFDSLCAFVQDLQDGSLRSLARPGTWRPPAPRGRATCEATLAALYSFFDYWRLEGRGPQDLRLYREGRFSGRTQYSFLAHVQSRRPALERRIKVRGPKSPAPKLIDFEKDYFRLIEQARTARDRTLLSAMYDGGLRISQALGLRHEDLDIARQTIHVVRRANPNGAWSKQRDPFVVHMPERFFEYYGASLVDEQLRLGIDSDYVFVNLDAATRGRPMSYRNAAQVVGRIGARAGVQLTPHSLRHTHGTDLAKRGWSGPEIAKRLGHSSATSSDVYIHLAEDHIGAKYAESFATRKEA